MAKARDADATVVVICFVASIGACSSGDDFSQLPRRLMRVVQLLCLLSLPSVALPYALSACVAAPFPERATRRPFSSGALGSRVISGGVYGQGDFVYGQANFVLEVIEL